jgi:hypothetical protein
MYQRNNRLSCCSRPRKRSSAPDPDGVFGIDFWHAVEFSRIGRAPRSGLSAKSRGNRSNLPRRFAGVKLVTRSPPPHVTLPRDRGPGVCHAWCGHPGNGHLLVSVTPCRATWRTLDSRRARVQIGWSAACGVPLRRAPGAGRRSWSGSRCARGRLGSERLGTAMRLLAACRCRASGRFRPHRMSHETVTKLSETSDALESVLGAAGSRLLQRPDCSDHASHAGHAGHADHAGRRRGIGRPRASRRPASAFV